MVWPARHKLQGGKYTIEKELQPGGFGMTYLARNARGERVVIKTLNDTVQKRPDFNKFQEDFRKEAERLKKCRHPHIVPIHDDFQEGTLWCVVMEYIEGEDLATHFEKRGVLPEVEALGYIQQIGEALTVVHSQGLLHRDVKPHNIMVRAGTSEAVLIDFGIAREFTPDLTQTHTEYRTEYFAPIEQYDRRAKRGAYTDVYALAATLYVILTGELPEPAPVRAAGTPLTPPKKHNPKISDKVNRAILKGMALKAKDRTQSVSKWLKLLGLRSSLTKTIISRNPADYWQWTAYIALGGVAVAILIGLTRQPVPSVESRSKTSSSEPIESPSQTSSPKRFVLTNTLTGHSSSVNSVAFSPDGQTLASSSEGKFLESNTIKLWNVRTGQLITTLTGYSDLDSSMVFSPDSQTLATTAGFLTNMIKLWNVRTGELKTTLTDPSHVVMSVEFSPDGQILAHSVFSSEDKTSHIIKLWNVRADESKTILTYHYSRVVWSAVFSPDGQTVAFNNEDKTIKLWNVRTGELKTTLFTGHSEQVDSVTFSPDGQTLASGSGDNTIKLWNVRTGELKTTLAGHSSSVSSVAFSPDGQTLASGSRDGTIKLWNTRTGELKTTLNGGSKVAFSPDGQILAFGGNNGTIKLWNTRTGELKTTLNGHSSYVTSVAFSPDGQTLVSGSKDNTIKIWRLSP